MMGVIPIEAVAVNSLLILLVIFIAGDFYKQFPGLFRYGAKLVGERLRSL